MKYFLFVLYLCVFSISFAASADELAKKTKKEKKVSLPSEDYYISIGAGAGMAGTSGSNVGGGFQFGQNFPSLGFGKVLFKDMLLGFSYNRWKYSDYEIENNSSWDFHAVFTYYLDTKLFSRFGLGAGKVEYTDNMDKVFNHFGNTFQLSVGYEIPVSDSLKFGFSGNYHLGMFNSGVKSHLILGLFELVIII